MQYGDPDKCSMPACEGAQAVVWARGRWSSEGASCSWKDSWRDGTWPWASRNVCPPYDISFQEATASHRSTGTCGLCTDTDNGAKDQLGLGCTDITKDRRDTGDGTDQEYYYFEPARARARA